MIFDQCFIAVNMSNNILNKSIMNFAKSKRNQLPK